MVDKGFLYAGEAVDFLGYLTENQEQLFLSDIQGKSVCCNCKFWEEHEFPAFGERETVMDFVEMFGKPFIHYVGDCKRHAPVERDETACWPETKHCDWCGDFEKR